MVVWGGGELGWDLYPLPPAGGALRMPGVVCVREERSVGQHVFRKGGGGGGVEPPLCRGHGGAHLD